ncbi:S41 family peptidase [Pseudoalteromonas obscura]|uniref:S41 family peptidase n=1 Tax=Pseudoalteromonas obscura TaxID=3048491 RepID=A0ABT7EM53_9GAMM|nr:S41 family peptidase [Pseudoalteromonas sp. P94(2023)]MDK2596098.1 S41 family peptidase [Pseudoalteromonas sp. P94(2023)]
MKLRQKISVIYVGILLTMTNTSHASDNAGSAVQTEFTDKAKYQAALPDIIEFSEFVHRVRYFYPSEVVSDTQWDYFLEHVISDMVKQPATARMQYAMLELKKVAPYIEVDKGKLPVLDKQGAARTWYNGAARWFYVYERTLLSDKPEELKSSMLTAKSDFYSDIYDSQAVYWPLYLSEQDSLAGKAFKEQKRNLSLHQPAMCMAALSSIWGEIYHFWPYFEQVDVNWQDSHSVLLQACIDEPGNFETTARRELSKLQDNHLYFGLPEEYSAYGQYSLPIRLQQIENKAILTHKTDYLSQQIDIGDELLAIDDVPVAELVNEMLGTRLRSKHFERSIAIAQLAYTYQSPDLYKLTFKKPSGEIITTTTATIHNKVIDRFYNNQTQPPLIKELGDGVVALRLYDIKEQAHYDAAKERLKTAQAIVLDMRGYPKNFALIRSLLGYFTDAKATIGPFKQFVQRLPNQADPHTLSFDLGVPLNEKLYDVPTVAISQTYNQSSGEHFLMIAQNMDIPIVGEVTAGINGDIMFGTVFSGQANGGVTYIYTASRSDQVDGSKLIGVGIQPDYLVPATQASIVESRDVQMEKATQLVRQALAR